MPQMTDKYSFSGHRARLRTEYKENGAEALKDRELLELLLTYSIPRVDVAPHARRLLESFGSLSRVLSASPERLSQVEGIGDSSAVFLSIVGAAAKRIIENAFNLPGKKQKLDNAECAAGLALALCMNDEKERLRLLCLDTRQYLIGTTIAAEGNINSVTADLRILLEKAFLMNAAAVILLHNHPSGNACPSPDDLETQHKLDALGKDISLPILDQLIAGQGAVYSFRCDRVFIVAPSGECRDVSLNEYKTMLE